MDSHPHRSDLGDLAGFGRLYRQTAGLVRSALPRLGVRDAAIDDATQDVYVVAYRRRAEFDSARPIEPWLLGIARRVAFRYRRSAARGQRKLAALTHVRESPQTEPLAAHLEARRFLERFLGELREERRAVFVLGELYGLTGPEIAARLRIPVDTAYTRLRATRRQLEQALLRRADADPPPSDAAVQRAWLLLLPRLGDSAPTGWLLLALGKAKLALAGTAVLAAVVIAPRLAPEPPAPPSAPAPIVAAAPAPAPTIEPLAPPPASRLEALLAPPAPPPRIPRPAPPDPLGAALLGAALEHLAADDPAAALTSLDRHAREFPTSPLAEARAVARVRARCQQGDLPRARQEAAALERDGLARAALAGTCVADP
jgi:RNA polymerase sigma factor (sigma-70 family)